MFLFYASDFLDFFLVVVLLGIKCLTCKLNALMFTAKVEMVWLPNFSFICNVQKELCTENVLICFVHEIYGGTMLVGSRKRNVSYIWADAAGLSSLGRTFSALKGLGAFGFRNL